jgi:galactokinase/mevalonate kinase-like predicted kinase
MHDDNYYELIMPARVNVLGNPADANEGAHATISAAIDTYAGAIIEPADGLVLEAVSRDGETLTHQPFTGLPPYPYDGTLDLLKGAVNRLYAYSSQFRQRLAERGGVRVATWTDVPRNSGLGGSSVLVLLTLAGLRCFYELDPRFHNDYVLSELAQRVEAKELGITCGFADRYVPLFGGLAYLDYRGKLHHRSVGEEPFVTYERLNDRVPDLPLVIAFTGVVRESGDVHSVMRGRYLEEYAAWEHGCPKPAMVDVMERVGATAWRGKMALLCEDWDEFGRLMQENHRLVDEVMDCCGLPGGAGEANNALVAAALEAGALGAKLTGAGGGGSVFALSRPGREEELVEALRAAAAQAGLEDARVWRAHVDANGLRQKRGPSGQLGSFESRGGGL